MSLSGEAVAAETSHRSFLNNFFIFEISSTRIIIRKIQKNMEKPEKVTKQGKNTLLILFKYYIIDGYKKTLNKVALWQNVLTWKDLNPLSRSP